MCACVFWIAVVCDAVFPALQFFYAMQCFVALQCFALLFFCAATFVCVAVFFRAAVILRAAFVFCLPVFRVAVFFALQIFWRYRSSLGQVSVDGALGWFRQVRG